MRVLSSGVTNKGDGRSAAHPRTRRDGRLLVDRPLGWSTGSIPLCTSAYTFVRQRTQQWDRGAATDWWADMTSSIAGRRVARISRVPVLTALVLHGPSLSVTDLAMTDWEIAQMTSAGKWCPWASRAGDWAADAPQVICRPPPLLQGEGSGAVSALEKLLFAP
jgi:hypothetical protein